MVRKDPRVDAYIAKAAPFAQPILAEIRERVHEGFPEISEAIKWGAPAFEHHGLVANMAAFKAHCAFGFWNPAIAATGREKEAMGSYGRIESVRDLPPKREFLALVKKAALANESGEKPKGVPKHPKKPAPEMPELKPAAVPTYIAIESGWTARSDFTFAPISSSACSHEIST